MKNIVKKIAAVTMAFTLLGTGTVITNTIKPQTNITLTAHAASCQYHGKQTYRIQYLGEIWYEYTWLNVLRREHQPVRYEYHCSACKGFLYNEYVDIVHPWEWYD